MAEIPRYELWAWVVREAGGREGVIAAILPGKERLGPMLLQSSRLEVAESMRSMAEQHHKASGKPVRLVHLLEEKP